MLKKITNKEEIAGLLYSHTLEEKVTGPNSKNPGTKYIRGRVDVQTDEEGMNIVTVNFNYVAPTCSTGKENRNYRVLTRIINEGRSVLEVGPESAMKVTIVSKLNVNDFINKDNEMISAMQNSGSFINIVTNIDPTKQRNYFETDILINNYSVVEADEEKNIKEDYGLIKGFVFDDYTKAICPVSFKVVDKGGMQYFEGLDASSQNPVFTKVWGNICNVTTTIKKEVDTAFGQPMIQEFSRSQKAYIVIGTNLKTYTIGDSEEDGISNADIQKAIADREQHLAEVKQNHETYMASKNAATSTTSSFTGSENNSNATASFNW